MNHHEDAEQTALFEWASYHPELKWLFSIPNGGNRNPREAARLKAQGVKPGVSDIFLPVARGGYQGLFIELKRRKAHGPSRVSKPQSEFLYDMTEEGYRAVVCYGAEDAMRVITEYMGL